MRQIAQLSTEQLASRFAAYLMTIGISAFAEPDGDAWSIWVKEEDQIERAHQELKLYLADPNAAKYQGVERQAEQLKQEQLKKTIAAKKRVVKVQSNWDRKQNGKRPLTVAIIVICAIVFVLTDFGTEKISQSAGMRALLFMDPIHYTNDVPQSEFDSVSFRLTDIKKGQIWRLITPTFVHFGIFHILMNMYVFWSLGGLIERRYSTVWLGILIFSLAIPSCVSGSLAPQAWQGSPFGAGFSGVIFGLFGYLWMKSTFDPNAGFQIPMGMVIFIIAYLFLGITGIFEAVFNIRVDNWAHGSGLVVGMAIGALPALLNPPRR